MIKKITLFTIVLIILTSCFSTSSISLHSSLVEDKFIINKNDKILLINNIQKDNSLYKIINNDYKEIFRNIIINHLYQDINGFITILDDKQLRIVKEETNVDKIIIIQSLMKYNFHNSEINFNKKSREYHITIRVIDLNTYKTLYFKEAMSVVKIPLNYSSISDSEKLQILKTYKTLHKDFKSKIL